MPISKRMRAMSSEIKIVKHVYNEGNNGYIQRFVVLNRLPKFEYVREGKYLVAEDSGFYSCYSYSEPYGRFKAFAGREFDIPLKGGGVVKAKGQWWNARHPYVKKQEILDYGYNTMEGLEDIFIFYGGEFNCKLLETCGECAVRYWDLYREVKNGKKDISRKA
jgi:hypothetical protein